MEGKKFEALSRSMGVMMLFPWIDSYDRTHYSAS